MEDHEHHHPLLPLVQHFGTKGALIVAVWGVKRLIKWRNSRHRAGALLSLGQDVPLYWRVVASSRARAP